MNNDEPIQAVIARALGLAKSRITALKKQGMPVHSIEAARAWREANLNPARRKALPGNPAETTRPAEHPDSMSCLLDLMGSMLDAGESIDVHLPTIRAVLAAVPVDQRHAVVFPRNMMYLLIGHVVAALPPAASNPTCSDGSPFYCDGAAMSDDDAAYCGAFWYRVAAGEMRLA